MPSKVLVAWFNYTVNGGIGRFVNLARALAEKGCALRFVSLCDNTRTAWPDFPSSILTLAEAERERWDAVMVPGAGADPGTLERLSVLRDERYGLRVQHVLNDPSKKEGFAVVNRVFAPHRVIFNNSHWQPADYRSFNADAFHVLAGAVDTRLFAPPPGFGSRGSALAEKAVTWIGGFASKNPEPLLEAMTLLPERFRLRLFGSFPDGGGERARTLTETGRLVCDGPLFGRELAAFYHGVDMVVTTETHAGWCNVAAEASACGVPCIVTPAGTLDFARNLHTALVLPAPDGAAIADAVLRLQRDHSLYRGISERAAVCLARFDWSGYAEAMLRLLEGPRVSHYYRIPELGLFGKWLPEERLDGLSPLFAACEGASVLDLGAAEGVVSQRCARHGAVLIHGFERDAGRVAIATRLLAAQPRTEAAFAPADLSDWGRFCAARALLPCYDIVLMLGLYQHLPAATRLDVLLSAVRKARRMLAVRTPRALAEADRLAEKIQAEGFRIIAEKHEREQDLLGWLGIFQRSDQS